ncbi:2-oxoglutarate dehydrogenase E1 component [Deferrisoma camini]|uniref:2-oxoglutarate dehydrogenase E1 component n=1 Tax=Deferrisoma camini TaxID=1035120 RepID=UPI00046CCA8E|nr:2-oxoglutarate dehydrogenase E1 component [Deferrisoma camini]
MPLPFLESSAYLEEQYRRYRSDPAAVTPEWRAFFEGFELGAAGPAPEATDLVCRVLALVERYRTLGHLLACLDPLAPCPTEHPLLTPSAVGLAPGDLDRSVRVPGFADAPVPVAEVVARLRAIYCGPVGYELAQVSDPAEKEWLRARIEGPRPPLAPAERRHVLDLLTRAQAFEEFLQKRYPGQTRFSLEGAESLLPLLAAAVLRLGARGVRHVVLGLAHRGRLNVQVNLLGRELRDVFCAFEASYDPQAVPGGGDVKYHEGFRGRVRYGDREVRVTVPENPSHLEAVNPVVEGIVRALQDRQGGPSATAAVLVHGDAAFAGQGIVAETLNLSRLEGYATGGTLHVVLNNQIGYTTPPEAARSTRYATDIAKMLEAPVFHVHAEHPEAAVRVARIAADYRAAFGKDVVIDLVGYRRHGHNEGDEPYFTQPLMYRRIRDRPPVARLYAQELVGVGVVPAEEPEAARRAFDEVLDEAHRSARSEPCRWTVPEPWEGWEGIGSRYTPDPVETGVNEEVLRDLGRRLWTAPEGFRLHPILARILDRRRKALEEGRTDWAGAEALAFASLLTEGVPVRLSGEDSRRGTFSQRHAVWFDRETGHPYCPLGHLAEGQAPFRAFDSPLSEAGVLGFEYGYSLVQPRSLVIWEAQYGDFANGAQVIVDQFVASAEAKWRRRSGLVLLLPHGYEGQGPDHSTARPERFLQLAAEDNLLLVQPTTPAQYFHALRRQVKAPYRKPLIVLTPKSLLRHPDVVSPLGDLADGGFRPVLDDPGVEAPQRVRRVCLCTGKVYYELAAARAKAADPGVALVRLEQVYPFPAQELADVLERYPRSAERVWVQEEPRNQGGWGFVGSMLAELWGAPPVYVGRPPAASPATGFSFIHREEQKRLVEEALTAGREPVPAGRPAA